MTTLPFEGTAPPRSDDIELEVVDGQIDVGMHDAEPADVGIVGALQERFAERLLALRRRGTGSDTPEARIALVGGLLLAAGVVLVLLAWYGASHTSRVYLQIPYLISGGLLGVVLAFAGGSAYLASWLTRLVQDQQARADEAVAASREMTAALGRIEALFASVVESDTGSLGSAQASQGDYVATPSGKLAHRPTCPTVAGRTDLHPVVVGPDGPAVCRMCDDAV